MDKMKTSAIFSRDWIYPVSILLITLALFILHFIFGSETFFKKRFLRSGKREELRRFQSMAVHYKRVSAFFLFGAVPVVLIKLLYRDTLGKYGLLRGNGRITPAIIIPVLIATGFTLIFFSKKPKVFSRYPEIERAMESRSAFAVSTLTYVLYFLGYESLYRGFLFFGLRGYIGNWGAVFVSMFFTVLGHLRTQKLVIAGSAATGLLFPYLVYLAGSIWPVFILHCVIGVFMDVFCIRSRRRLPVQSTAG